MSTLMPAATPAPDQFRLERSAAVLVVLVGAFSGFLVGCGLVAFLWLLL